MAIWQKLESSLYKVVFLSAQPTVITLSSFVIVITCHNHSRWYSCHISSWELDLNQYFCAISSSLPHTSALQGSWTPTTFLLFCKGMKKNSSFTKASKCADTGFLLSSPFTAMFSVKMEESDLSSNITKPLPHALVCILVAHKRGY